MKEALLYKKNQDNSTNCFLCNHFCKISGGKVGICRVRRNINGRLFSLNYSNLIATNLDPIEKKPFFHFFPGSSSYSIASLGCNFSCDFCQNWSISQADYHNNQAEGHKFSPQDVVIKARELGCRSIAYTYSEPTVFFEFAYDVSRIAKENRISNLFVTNGYISRDALDMITPYLDGANVDLKSFSDSFYRKICKATLKPVLESIELIKKRGIWLEVTTLIIPGLNDSKEELGKIASFISNLGIDIPWHISRFFPSFKASSLAPTQNETLKMAYEIGKKSGLRYVYTGNCDLDKGRDTFCPQCQETLIKRDGFLNSTNNIRRGRCRFCDFQLDGVFE